MAILAQFAMNGPMSAAQLMQALDKPRGTINSAISCAREHGTKYIRIVAWEPQRGRRGQMTPIYGRGFGARDAPRPPALTRKEIHQRYRRKNAEILRCRDRARRRTPWDGLHA
jgi:hypothetical protein